MTSGDYCHFRRRGRCPVQPLRCPPWSRGDGRRWVVSCNPVYGMLRATMRALPLPPRPDSFLFDSDQTCDDHVYCEIGVCSDLSQIVVVEETRL
ncbi:MAG: ORF20A protein [Psittacine adenovirus 12]